MKNRLYWGLGVLILLVGGFVFYQQWTDIQQLKQDPAEAQKLLEEKTKPIAENAKPAARDGFKMVQHDDHWHEVPIDAPDVSQEETHNTPTVPEASVEVPQGSTQNAAWVEWSKKYNELSKAFLQASASDVLPSTEDEEKRFETDDQYRKEVQRKYSEALQKSAKIYTRMKALEKENPLLQVNK